MVAGIIRRQRTDSEERTTTEPTGRRPRPRPLVTTYQRLAYVSPPLLLMLLLLLLTAPAASRPSNSGGVLPPGCAWRSFLAAAPPSPVLPSTGRPGGYLRLSDEGAFGEERRSGSACGCWDGEHEGCCC